MMIKYNLTNITNVADINKIYKGNRLIYQKLNQNVTPLPPPPDADIAFEFTGDTAIYVINNNAYTATTTPYSTTLQELGINDKLFDVNFSNNYAAVHTKNITHITKLPDNLPANMDNRFSFMDNVITINISNLNANTIYNFLYTFRQNPKMKSVILPPSGNFRVSKLNYTFYYSGLENIDFHHFSGNDVKTMEQCFNSCKKLKTVRMDYFEGNELENLSYSFNDCSNLQELSFPRFTGNKLKHIAFMCAGCTSLKKLDLSKFHFMQHVGIDLIINECTNLKYFNGFDLKNINNGISDMTVTELPHLRYMAFKNFGNSEKVTKTNCKIFPNWGVDDDGMTNCKDSVISTLITNSWDRSRMTTFTITLSPATMAILTEDEVAQITSKNYTIAM